MNTATLKPVLFKPMIISIDQVMTFTIFLITGINWSSKSLSDFETIGTIYSSIIESIA
jgi:hypothetical protein